MKQLRWGLQSSPLSHLFKAEFTWIVESCQGQKASASINLNVTPASDDPVAPDTP